MFGPLATQLGAAALLTTTSPADVSEYLEELWSTARLPLHDSAIGVAAVAGQHQAMARATRVGLPGGGGPILGLAAPVANTVAWHHVAYAYLLENTRMVEILRRVVHEWTHGERLPAATIGTQRWLQVTEQLFFQDAWTYSVRAVTSSIRRSADATRRGAYYRLLGMDLNHPLDEPGASSRPDAANRDFAAVFEALLSEVWKGYTSRTAIAAVNETDDSAIHNLVRRLREMLTSRRLNGTLSREEFDAIALLSWLHVTLDAASPIVANLQAHAAGYADRLAQIGERIGVPSHARSDAYFQLAEPVSRILRAMEANAAVNWPQALYNGIYTGDMLQIILNWSIATGRDVKSWRPSASTQVLASTGSGRAGMSTPAGNGSARVVPFTR